MMETNYGMTILEKQFIAATAGIGRSFAVMQNESSVGMRSRLQPERDRKRISASEVADAGKSTTFGKAPVLEVGLVEQARARAQLAKDAAARSHSPRADVLAAIAEGLTEIHAGNADIGLTRLKRAVERARAQMPSMLHDALAALIKGYETAGQPDAALVYLREVKRLPFLPACGNSGWHSSATITILTTYFISCPHAPNRFQCSIWATNRREILLSRSII